MCLPVFNKNVVIESCGAAMLKGISIGFVLALFVALLVALLVILPATEQGFQKGMAAVRSGDYATALREWRPLAERGHAKAQYNLGVMHLFGHGVPKNHAEAVKWLQKAAKKGEIKAQNSLGFMYQMGQGVRQDYAIAVKWYRKAAEGGLAKAQYNLGILYGRGAGLRQDYILSHVLLSLSALKGIKDAIKARDIIARRMTPAQLAEAQKLVREWQEQNKRIVIMPSIHGHILK